MADLRPLRVPPSFESESSFLHADSIGETPPVACCRRLSIDGVPQAA